MRLIYRPIEVWPGKHTDPRKPSPFEATWTATLELLDRELNQLGVTEAVLQVDSPSERDFRLDGGMRADARLRSPAVILSIETRRHGKLSYPCDTFTRRGYRESLQDWQVNVRAIALGLEALRKVERYGIANTGQQYTGWKQLGSGIAMGAASTQMSVEDAARCLADLAVMYGDSHDDEIHPWGRDGKGWAVLVREPEEMERAYKMAARWRHPDVPVTGNADLFKKLTAARDILTRYTRN